MPGETIFGGLTYQEATLLPNFSVLDVKFGNSGWYKLPNEVVMFVMPAREVKPDFVWKVAELKARLPNFPPELDLLGVFAGGGRSGLWIVFTFQKMSIGKQLFGHGGQ